MQVDEVQKAQFESVHEVTTHSPLTTVYPELQLAQQSVQVLLVHVKQLESRQTVE